MAMTGVGIREPHAAPAAQPRTIGCAERRERQFENQRVPERWLKVEKIPVQKISVIAWAADVVSEQLLKTDPRRGRELIQAPRALAGQRGRDARRHQDPLADLLQLNLELKAASGGNVHHAGAKIGRRRNGTALRARRN